MFVIQNLAGLYWNGAVFGTYNKGDAKSFISFMEATTKAAEVNGLVSDTDGPGFTPLKRLYFLLAVNDHSGYKEPLTTVPFTHDECCTIRKKLTVHANRSLILSEVKYQTVEIESLSGISLIWSAAVMAGKEVELGLLQGEKVIFHRVGQVKEVFNPLENQIQTAQLLEGFKVSLFPDDAVKPKAIHTPFDDQPLYYYRHFGDTINEAALKCFVRSKTGRSDVISIPDWLEPTFTV